MAQIGPKADLLVRQKQNPGPAGAGVSRAAEDVAPDRLDKLGCKGPRSRCRKAATERRRPPLGVQSPANGLPAAQGWVAKATHVVSKRWRGAAEQVASNAGRLPRAVPAHLSSLSLPPLSAAGAVIYLAASSKFSTSSGTSSSSSPSAACADWYCAAIFFRLARLSGPSWLMMPGSRSCSFLVCEGPLTT